MKKSTEFAVELDKKLIEPQQTNDLALLQKLGNEGAEAIKKLQADYYDYLRSKGKKMIME